VLYTVYFTAFCLGGAFFPGHGVLTSETMPVMWLQFYIVRDSICEEHCMSVRPSVCPSVTRVDQTKWLKLGLCNFIFTVQENHPSSLCW